MKIKTLFYSSIAALTLASCNDSFLDRSSQSINDQTFWNTAEDLKTYANFFYTLLPSGLASTDDDTDTQVPNSLSAFLWNQKTTPFDAEDWCKWDKDGWANIRTINYFLTHYQTAVGKEADINQSVAEVRFFKAQQYGGLMRTFGDIPWLDKELGTGDTEVLYGPKLKRYEIMDKIIEEFDFAIQWLPEKPEAGRIGKDVARHLKARTCLHEATYYKYHTELGWIDKAERLFKMAVDETSAIMATGNYEIYDTGHPTKDYYDVFVIDDKTNLKEAILPVSYLKDKRMHNTSRVLGGPEIGFSKDFVESYLCSDGKPISGNLLYKGDATMKDESTNRDPRFKQTVLTGEFPTLVITTTNDSSFITKEEDFVTNKCFTGYRTIKYFIPTDKAAEAGMDVNDGIAYRYAETLLINAEAKAELSTITQADLDKTINLLRDRVEMPHLALTVGFTDPNWPNWGYSLTPLLQEIRRERRIELAGESLRGDDIMRWKAGQLCNNVKTYLGKREPYKDGKYAIPYPAYTNSDYSYEPGKSRTWNDKLYLRPIPTVELQRNENLLPQNPGW